MSDTNTRKPKVRPATAAGERARLRRSGFAPFAALRDERGRFPLSRLTVTIFLTNLFGLTLLMALSLRFSPYRDDLIDAKLEGVRAQAEVMAAILAAVAAEDAACDIAAPDGGAAPCVAQLNPQAVNTIFTRVWPSFAGRVRVFETPPDYAGQPITDLGPLLLQDKLLREGSFVVSELPDLDDTSVRASGRKFFRGFRDSFVDTFIDPGFRDAAERNTLTGEVTAAFLASASAPKPGVSALRYDEEGHLVASVSVPIRKVQAVYGVVTAEIGGIETVLGEARAALFNVFLAAALVGVILSLILSWTIAGPIRRLADAADRVRDGVRGTGKMRIPEFPNRRDEIGELSDSLKSMTHALYDRIETIDSFAADVSHELKNPLTSIRSAIETLDITTREDQRARLLSVINNDVRRMDRLITDIANASRLDAELAMESREAIDILLLLRDIADAYATMRKPGQPAVRFLGREGTQPLFVFGSPSTLGQVFRNLIDNAISFSPADAAVRITAQVERRADGPAVVVSVADDGPGIPPENVETIFRRFYTRRPQGAAFGNNSGLGLAICRQITESHGGRIWAENRMNTKGTERVGAVFHVSIPLRRQA